MLWANSQPPRCGSVKGFHACTNVAMRIPDSRSTAKRKWHTPQCAAEHCSALRHLQAWGRGLQRAAAHTAKTERGAGIRGLPGSAPAPGARSFGSHHLRSHDSGDLIHRKRSPFPVRGEGSWLPRAVAPTAKTECGARIRGLARFRPAPGRDPSAHITREAMTAGTSSTASGPPSPCAGKALCRRQQAAPTAETGRGARRPHPSSASREIGGCHLPRARGRLLAGDRKGAGRPYGFKTKN